MKKTRRTKPTANKLSILHQLCNYIPGHLVVNLARKQVVYQFEIISTMETRKRNKKDFGKYLLD